MEAVRKARHSRQIDAHIEKGASCVSMCVPIFLLGANRTAHPDAYFMFHEASLAPKADARRSMQKSVALDPAYRKQIETIVTDQMYATDIGGQRVNSVWLREMRAKIVGTDIWLTAQQLVGTKSGVIDALYK